MLIGAAATQKSKQKNLPKAPELLPWSHRTAVREQWLVKRHAMLLDMMRRNHVDMWIVVNEEFHTIRSRNTLPRRASTRAAAIFSCSWIPVAKGSKNRRHRILGRKRPAILREHRRPSQTPSTSSSKLCGTRNHPAPHLVGIDGRRGVTRSLTKSTYDYPAEKMGPDAAKNFVPAQELIGEYLATGLPEEFDTYNQEVILTPTSSPSALPRTK